MGNKQTRHMPKEEKWDEPESTCLNGMGSFTETPPYAKDIIYPERASPTLSSAECYHSFDESYILNSFENHKNKVRKSPELNDFVSSLTSLDSVIKPVAMSDPELQLSFHESYFLQSDSLREEKKKIEAPEKDLEASETDLINSEEDEIIIGNLRIENVDFDIEFDDIIEFQHEN